MKRLLTIFSLAVMVAMAGIPTIQNANAGETTFSGFVDMSYSTDENAKTNTFGMDQVELDVNHKVDDIASARFDLQYNSGTAAMSTDDIVEQAFIEIAGPAGIKITAGKFNAPIGFELLDAPDMFQFSHAMIFDSGLPTNLTGLMVSSTMGMFDLSLYYVNGWDKITDDNTEKTTGARLGISPMEGLNVGISHIRGAEVETSSLTTKLESKDLIVTDIDFTFTGVEGLTIGAEYNIGTFKGQSEITAGADAEWTGYLVMGHFDFTDSMGLTLRYDAFHDKDGLRLAGGVGDETRTSVTISPTFVISEALGALIEYRTYSSDKSVFTKKGGATSKTSNTLAGELTYSF